MVVGQETVPEAGTPPRPASELMMAAPCGPGWVSHSATEVTTPPDSPVYQALRSPPMVPGTPPDTGPANLGPSGATTALAAGVPSSPEVTSAFPAITEVPWASSLTVTSRVARGLRAAVPRGWNVHTRCPSTVTDRAMARSW